MTLHRRHHRRNAPSKGHAKVRDAMATIRKHQDELSETEQDEIVDFALELIRRDYYSSVKSFADDLRDEIKRGEIADEDALRDALHQTVDGSAWIIYTKRAKLVLMASDNEDVAEEEGLEHETTEQRAFYAMMRDIEDELGDTRDLFEEQEEED